MTFRAPVRDLAFSLRHVAGFDRLADAFPDADADTVAAVLEAAGVFAAEVLAPLNRQGDLVGAKLENGVVAPPRASPTPIKQFAQGGWTGLGGRSRARRPGLPKTLEVATLEMVQAANMAFGLCPMLSLGAIEALAHHGTDRQKALYLPKLVSGEWTGTMNLTEPQAGSDLGALTSMATPDGDGGWTLSGQKIFITWGDHDAADNIVHLIWPARPTRLPGSRASRCSWPPRCWSTRGQAGRGQRPAGRRAGAQAGHPRLAHLRDAV
jgi:alkylation response protein AidB-like acyl-CoA dehydrogenase